MTRSALVLAYLQLSHAFHLAPRPPHLPAASVRQPRAAVGAALPQRPIGDGLGPVALAGLASLVLIASPMAASAKGGGHGGGGHGGGGHSHSSHSSSSSRPVMHSSRTSRRRSRDRSSGFSSSRTYHSTTYASPPPVRLFPDEKLARQGEGFYCPASLPKPGERVDVQGAAPGYRTAKVISSTPAMQSTLYYGKAGRVLSPVPGFEEDCTVTAQYSDGTTGTLSAAEEPAPLWQEVAPLVAYGAVLGVTSGLPDGESAWASAEEEHEDLLAKLKASGDATAPPSGEYWGKSEESDEGDQAVRSTISFRSDGTVTGRGKDGVDGAYRITRGRWGVRDNGGKPTEVAWIEVYDEGFSVAVKGKYHPRSGTLKARFTSSRGVRGTFELAPKPSIF